MFKIPNTWKEQWTKYPHGFSVMEMLADWATKANGLLNQIEKKTDLTGDHKGTWQGLHPVEAEPGLSALVLDIISRLADKSISVKEFGAKGDGVTDDTVAIQNTFNEGVATGRTVFIPAGTYMINPAVGLVVPSFSKVVFAPTAVLKNIPHNETHYQMLHMSNKEGIVIAYPRLDGSRDDNLAVGGEWGHGINIRGSKDITIIQPTISNCWGDGIYIGSTLENRYSENITIYNPVCDNNRRQGISIISVKGLRLYDPVLKNTNGTSPEMGIDFEPNDIDEILQDVVVYNPYTENNGTVGIGFYLGNVAGSPNPIDVTIINHRNNGGDEGLKVEGFDGVLPGQIKVVDPYWEDSRRAGFVSRNWPNTFPKVTLINPTVINCNRGGSNSSQYDSAFTIYAEPEDSGESSLGNIHIINPTITTTEGNQPPRAFFFQDFRTPSYPIIKCSIIDPYEISASAHPLTRVPHDEIVLTDKHRTLVRALNANETIQGSSLRRTYTTTNQTANRTWTLSKFGVFTEIDIEHVGGYTLTITPEETDTIKPLGGVGQSIRSSTGGFLSLRKITPDQWIITAMTGTWTPVE